MKVPEINFWVITRIVAGVLAAIPVTMIMYDSLKRDLANKTVNEALIFCLIGTFIAILFFTWIFLLLFALYGPEFFKPFLKNDDNKDQ